MCTCVGGGAHWLDYRSALAAAAFRAQSADVRIPMPNFAITAGALPYHADYREKEQEGTSDKATANGQSERGGRLGVSQFAGRVEHLGADRIEAQRAVVGEEVAKATTPGEGDPWLNMRMSLDSVVGLHER